MNAMEMARIASEKARLAREKKENKARNGIKVPTKSEVASYWLKWSSQENNPSAREVQALRSLWKRYLETRKNNPCFYELLKWSLENWNSVMGYAFRTMSNPPSSPSILFFVKCVDRFVDSYNNEENMREEENMTTREIMVSRIIRKGNKTKEAAEREVDEKMGLLKLRAQIAEEARKLKQFQNNQSGARALFDRVRNSDNRPSDNNEFEKWI